MSPPKGGFLESANRFPAISKGLIKNLPMSRFPALPPGRVGCFSAPGDCGSTPQGGTDVPPTTRSSR